MSWTASARGLADCTVQNACARIQSLGKAVSKDWHVVDCISQGFG